MEDLITRAARDIARSRYAIALAGAGVSTESGIPDFRGPSGLWTKDPEAEKRAYQSYRRFVADPKKWWQEVLSRPLFMLEQFAQARPNPGHHALAELERIGVLKCLITQNIDGLHARAGSKNLLEYHGSIFKLRCTACAARFERDEFDLARLFQEDALPPRCPRCNGAIKTDGVSFGEPIPLQTAQRSLEEACRCDVMLVCGTSAVVYPFASLPRIAHDKRLANGIDVTPYLESATVIEVNAEPTPLTVWGVSDYLIQGKTGEILPRIAAEVKQLRASA